MNKAEMLYVLRNVRPDMRLEMKKMFEDLLPVCPVDSPDFNAFAIAWIEKNAAKFRKKWERYRFRTRRKEYVVGN